MHRHQSTKFVFNTQLVLKVLIFIPICLGHQSTKFVFNTQLPLHYGYWDFLSPIYKIRIQYTTHSPWLWRNFWSPIYKIRIQYTTTRILHKLLQGHQSTKFVFNTQQFYCFFKIMSSHQSTKFVFNTQQLNCLKPF